uniref:Uncharacterized protein n=1 Tax=Plectus sambesii TaxID=2011161 RepID=A0A914WEI8_9BILA
MRREGWQQTTGAGTRNWPDGADAGGSLVDGRSALESCAIGPGRLFAVGSNVNSIRVGVSTSCVRRARVTFTPRGRSAGVYSDLTVWYICQLSRPAGCSSAASRDHPFLPFAHTVKNLARLVENRRSVKKIRTFSACQTGESLFKSENTRQAILCGDDGTCPSTHICRYDSLFRRHVCCGYKQSGTCAAGLRTYFNSLTAKPLSCTANQIKDECPPDFVCTWNVDSREHFCCSIDHGVCPAGQIPYNHPISKMTLKCNPLTYKDSCPMGYTCSVTVIGASWGFCCSTDIIANCPLNFVPFISPVTNEVQLCTVGVTVCSETGYECKNRDPQAIIGFCCSSSEIYTGMVVEPIQAKSQRDEQYFGSGIMRRLIDIQKEIDASEKVLHDDYCPGDYAAWIYPGTNFPLLCNIQEDTCPENSTCVPNANNEAHCCIRQEVPEDRRMKPEETTSPETVVIDTDDPYCPRMVEERNCVPGSTLNCPEYGFFCQFNVIHQAYRCCSVLKP